MKTFTFLTALLSIFLALTGQAQDLILLTSGDEIRAKITEVTPAEIWYKKPDSLQGRTFSLPKQSVFMLKYANGAKELMKPYQPADTLAASTRTQQQLYEQGRQDARRYYRGNGAMWASAGATLLLGIPGPILVGAIPPKIKARDVPNPRLLESTYYRSGFQAQAHRKKMGKAATGAGIAVGAVLVIAVSVLANFQ
jgi:hypothetical protein